MDTINVYSSFTHSFGVHYSNHDIHYYENRWVKAPLNHVICIDSACEEAHGFKFSQYIGKCIQPEYSIGLWATKIYEERKMHDFISLKMRRQIVHLCNGEVIVYHKHDWLMQMETKSLERV